MGNLLSESSIKWCILNIGTPSRNFFWGEKPSKAYRNAVCTTTLIHTDGVNILVDPSMEKDEMAAVLDARCGITYDDIDIVYITHFHEDHFKGLEAFGDSTWVSSAGELSVKDTQKTLAEKNLLGKIMPIKHEIEHNIKLIYLPGHTMNMHGLIFKAHEGTIILASDAVVSRDHFYARKGHFVDVNLLETKKTMDMISKRADVVIPGHDNYFIVQEMI